MKKHYFEKAVEIPLYRGNLVIILTDNVKKLRKKFDFDTDNLYAHTFFSSYKKKQGFFVVLNFNHETTKIHPGIITHEALHLTHFIAERRGFRADFNNDEPLAYLIEWITNEIHKFMEETKI